MHIYAIAASTNGLIMDYSLIIIQILSIGYHYYPRYIEKKGKKDIDMFAGRIIVYIYAFFVVCCRLGVLTLLII